MKKMELKKLVFLKLGPMRGLPTGGTRVAGLTVKLVLNL